MSLSRQRHWGSVRLKRMAESRQNMGWDTLSSEHFPSDPGAGVIGWME